MKIKKVFFFAILFLLSLSLCGCSEFRNTFSGFWGNVEKTGKNSHEFTSPDEEWQMPVSVNHENPSDEIYFFSSNENVATVSETGVIKPVSNGTAVITAAYLDGSDLISVRVSVSFSGDFAEEASENLTKEDLRGVWVSTVWNIDFPSESGLSEEQLKSEIDEIMTNAASWGLNAVFFQVRPMSDSVYPSSIFPSSSFITGEQGGELPFDILEYAVAAAHENGLELHAWINPFRISFSSLYSTNSESLAETNPARLHPEYTVEFENALYYNPGLPEVREMVVSEVEEIINNYDVDGIHFDDYFYPSGSSEEGAFDDSDAYEKYGGDLSLSDWRRENVNSLIKEVHNVVKEKSSDVVFGVSPGGIWATKQNNDEGVEGLGNTSQTYYDVYADTKKWVEDKIVDYICPQIYWHIDSSIAPFEPIAEWWSDLCDRCDVALYVGIAAYKGESGSAYQTPDEIKNEISYLQTLSRCDGEVYFSYSSLEENLAQVVDTLKEIYSD